MRDWKMIWRAAKTAALTLAGWLAFYRAAFAAQAAPAGLPKQEDNGGGSYVLPYAIVLLGIGLGMLFVCRSSNRRERAKPEQYEESKITTK